MKMSQLIDEGLDALKRSSPDQGHDLVKPYYTCYHLKTKPVETFCFQSLDDCLAVARMISLGPDSAKPLWGTTVYVSHVPSYAVSLAYVKTKTADKDGYVFSQYFLASDGIACENPVSIDVIKSLAEGSFIDSAEFARRKLDKEFDRVMSESTCGLGKDILIPGLPDKWYAWDLEIEQRIELLHGEMMHKGLFIKFHATNLADALAILFDYSNRKSGLHYWINARGFNTGIRWYADWPINRRGSMDNVFGPTSDVVDDFELRDGRQDTLVIRVYNKRHVSAFGTKQVYCMRVGGDTKEEAIENWTICARAIRKIMKAK